MEEYYTLVVKPEDGFMGICFDNKNPILSSTVLATLQIKADMEKQYPNNEYHLAVITLL